MNSPWYQELCSKARNDDFITVIDSRFDRNGLILLRDKIFSDNK